MLGLRQSLFLLKQQNKRFFNENQLPYFAENVIFDLTILKSVFFVMQNILKSVKKYHVNILKSVKSVPETNIA